MRRFFIIFIFLPAALFAHTGGFSDPLSPFILDDSIVIGDAYNPDSNARIDLQISVIDMVDGIPILGHFIITKTVGNWLNSKFQRLGRGDVTELSIQHEFAGQSGLFLVVKLRRGFIELNPGSAFHHPQFAIDLNSRKIFNANIGLNERVTAYEGVSKKRRMIGDSLIRNSMPANGGKCIDLFKSPAPSIRSIGKDIS